VTPSAALRRRANPIDNDGLRTPRPLFRAPFGLLLALAGCATAPPATNSAPAPAARADDGTVDRSIPTTSPELAAFDVPAGELPAGLSMAPGEPRCVSIQPLTFYAQPATFGMVPKPRARRALVMHRGDRVVGSVLLFAYADGQIPTVRQFLDGLLWGEERAPSAEHPEQVAVAGNVLAILCLDERDAAATWYANRLRTHHRARVPAPCPVVQAIQAEARKARDPQSVDDIVARHEQELLACSTGALFVGVLARGQKDYARSERAFRRALELDAAGDAFAVREGEYAARDGVALAVALQGRAAESLPLFEQASAAAQRTGDREVIAHAEYNLACAYAEAGRAADASTALKRAVAIDAKYKQTARTDDSFQKVRGAPELKWIQE
jgi:hypothetical protein